MTDTRREEMTVKPLEWTRDENYLRAYDAETRLGYEIQRKKGGTLFVRQPGTDWMPAETRDEIRLAKILQADYERRILSAITPAPEAGWRQGIEQAAELAENFTSANHVAQDIKDGIFPEQSPIREAMARAIRGIEAPGTQPATEQPVYETCSKCSGSGQMIGDAGEPTLCSECKGDTVVASEQPSVKEAVRRSLPDSIIMEVTERVLHDMGHSNPAMSKLHHRQFLKAALRSLAQGDE